MGEHDGHDRANFDTVTARHVCHGCPALAACREQLAASEKRASDANERAAEMMRMADDELCDCENTLPSGSLCGWCKTTCDLRMTLATSDLRSRYTALHRAASALSVACKVKVGRNITRPDIYDNCGDSRMGDIARAMPALIALLTEPAGGREKPA